MKFKSIATGVALGALACITTASFGATESKKPSAVELAVSGSWRPAEEKSRDVYRHPVDALQFWGLKPGMTILEVQPGGGWWTNVLAPYAHLTHGKFYATAADISDPELSEGARKGRADFAAKYADESVYGKVNLVNWGAKAAPLPAKQFDFVLLARSMHDWVNRGTAQKNLADIFQATRPGGVLAIEQHRAKAGQDPKVFNGYLDEAYVIQLAEQAGYKLDGKSEINANPKDTKDHPFGVWTLPPTRRSSDGNNPVDPSFDRARYDAIGESDRMTLRFVKPKK